MSWLRVSERLSKIPRAAMGGLLAMAVVVTHVQSASAVAPLDLNGYADANGAITVLKNGDSVDPYFAMQALLLAQENGVNVDRIATAFVKWLLPRQKLDGTFDRFCRSGRDAWVSCKPADADDSLLAIWMKLLETMPAQLEREPSWTKSYNISKVALDRLYQPSRGIYMVSPLVLHGLFMDNLEVWSLKSHGGRLNKANTPARRAEAETLAKGIQSTFFDPVNKRYWVSTQLEQRLQDQKPAFYPEYVAQIFPLLVDFKMTPDQRSQLYRQWMREHRDDWLEQSEKDYPWGLLAVLAMREKDTESVRCWLRQATPLRHSNRWAITDEVAYQLVTGRGLRSADDKAACQ